MLNVVRCSMVKMHIETTKDMKDIVKIVGQKRLEAVYETFPLEEASHVLQKEFRDGCPDSTNSINHTQ